MASFIATSNKVTPTPVPGVEDGTHLREIIRNSTTFYRAFENQKCKIIQSSQTSSHISSAPTGLVSAISRAYNTHHNLVLRPDDVWQAILTQFSFYVNANAEDLRDAFVDFEGKKNLEIWTDGTLFTADFADMANRMVDEQIATNIKDRTVTEWLIPNFSTTRPGDRVAASVTIMSTLQAYFNYGFCLSCGIPKVTLEGTPEDWRALRQKIERLPQYNIEGKDKVMTKWHLLLSQVLDAFVASAEGTSNLEFWDTVLSHHGGGSGPSYISGWVTVFACFDAKGKWQGETRGSSKWPRIDTKDIPMGAVSVPVVLDDNGTKYDAQLVAGQMAFEVHGERLDTIQPRNDWCFAIKE